MKTAEQKYEELFLLFNKVEHPSDLKEAVVAAIKEDRRDVRHKVAELINEDVIVSNNPYGFGYVDGFYVAKNKAHQIAMNTKTD